jgi:hypothetical protein
MSGLERDFDIQPDYDIDNNDAQLTKVKEGLFPSGLYFKQEDGSQGIAPRAQDSNSFNLTDEEMAKKELLAKKLIDSYPTVSQGVIDFACSFYMKNPEKFKEIIHDSKNKESKSVQQIVEMKEKYGAPEEERFNSQLFDMNRFLENNNNTINFENIKI